MRSNIEILEAIIVSGIVAVIRVNSAQEAVEVCGAIAKEESSQ